MFGIVNIQLKSSYQVLYMIKTQFVREGKSGAMPIWQFGIIDSSRSLSWRIHFTNGDIGWIFILPNISISQLTTMKSSTTLLIIIIHNECNYQIKPNQSSFSRSFSLTCELHFHASELSPPSNMGIVRSHTGWRWLPS